ncbi:MAG: DUF1573 domain-containing protein [Bacteroidales bacterium]|jgi:hypothetical protein|nr:DUF1573 domain-containing protein [Bacteroidales bacterium]
MKRGLFISVMVVSWALSLACNRQQPSVAAKSDEQEVDTLKLTSVEYLVTEHDFGKIKEGEKVSYRFEFKNTGENNLIVKEVRTYCGCTASQYTKAPVAPGSKGFVEITFDSTQRPGKQEKNFAIATNTVQEYSVLTFSCEVEPK